MNDKGIYGHITNNQEQRKYTNIEYEKNFLRESIDGCLNRISVTDNEEERNKMFLSVTSYVLDYIRLSEKAHVLHEKILNKGQ